MTGNWHLYSYVQWVVSIVYFKLWPLVWVSSPSNLQIETCWYDAVLSKNKKTILCIRCIDYGEIIVTAELLNWKSVDILPIP